MSIQGQMKLPPLNLTHYPRMRKKRPSYSPIKSVNETPAGRGYSSNPSTSQKLANLPSADNYALNTGFASLQFKEFSWDDGKGGYNGVSADHFGKLNSYLMALYPEVRTIEERVPYLVIWCKESIPEPSQRPFLIAGLLGVWLIDGPDNLPPEFISGFVGNIGVQLDLDDDLAEDIREYHIPKTETLCRLMYEHFPDALAISFVDNEILVELPELSVNEHSERLQKRPSRFWHNGAPSLFYYNGLRIMGQQNMRLKQPQPQTIDGQFDDSDYVAARGYFQPGSMICDDVGSMVSAGILVKRGDERRLTVSIHCWQKELDEIPEKMGDLQSFRVTQGKTHVGYVSSRLGNTDIGLATLNNFIEFRNQFIDLPGGPTRLLRSDMLKANDFYMIDSFTTGRQGGLLCKGKRIISQDGKEKRTDQVLRGNQKDLPDAGLYMVLVQGIFATSEPTANGEPIIRAGCCGSAVVRLAKTTRPRDRKITAGKESTPNNPGDTLDIRDPSKPKKASPKIATPEKSSSVSAESSGLYGEIVEIGFENDGEIGGFMHWSDLQEKTTHTNIPRLFCYAEVTDPLIDAGWELAKTAEKRKRSSSEDPFAD